MESIFQSSIMEISKDMTESSCVAALMKMYQEIVQSGSAKCDYLYCSAFIKGDRDYECNQRTRTILKKERVHISSQERTVPYDRLTSTSDAARPQ